MAKKILKSKAVSKLGTLRSSSAEYLTFISAAGGDEHRLELRYEDENIWMTQKMMAELYGVSVSAINQHLKKLIADGEINNSVIKQYLITATDGKRYNTEHYGLQAIISVGFKIENERSVQFRKWARKFAETEFEKYRITQDRLFESDFDKLIKKLDNNQGI